MGSNSPTGKQVQQIQISNAGNVGGNEISNGS
jgi:hypothetical protein